jgi:metal-responsive CopG/Arc/MetJ family transcriptional regulator
MEIQINIDQSLVSRVDAVTTDRDSFINRAVLKELRKNEGLSSQEIDVELIAAFTRKPQEPDEYMIWQDEQVWED